MAIEGIKESTVADFIQDANSATNFGEKRAVVDDVNVDDGTIRWHVESKFQRVVRFFIPNTTKHQNENFAKALASFKDTVLSNQTSKINEFASRVEARPKLGSTNPLRLFNELPENGRSEALTGSPSLSGRSVATLNLNRTHSHPAPETSEGSHQETSRNNTAPPTPVQSESTHSGSDVPTFRSVETGSDPIPTSAVLQASSTLRENDSSPVTPESDGGAELHDRQGDVSSGSQRSIEQSVVVDAFLDNVVTTPAALESISGASLTGRGLQTPIAEPSEHSVQQALLLSEVLSALDGVQRLKQQSSSGSSPSAGQLQEAFVQLDELQGRFNELQAQSSDPTLASIADALTALTTTTTALIGGQITADNSIPTSVLQQSSGNASALHTVVESDGLASQQGLSADQAFALIRDDYNSLLARIKDSASSPNAIEELLKVRDQINNALEPAIIRYVADHPDDAEGITALEQRLFALNGYLNRVTKETLDGPADTQLRASAPNPSTASKSKAPSAGPQHRSVDTPSQPAFYREHQTQQFCSIAALNAFAGEPVLTKQAGAEALKKGWVSELPTDPTEFREKVSALYGEDYLNLFAFLDRYDAAVESENDAEVAALRESFALARFTKALRFEFGQNLPAEVTWETPFTNGRIGGIAQGDVVRLARNSDIGRSWDFSTPLNLTRNTSEEVREKAFEGVDRALVNRNGHWVTYRQIADGRWFEVNSSDENGRFSRAPKSINPAKALKGLEATVITARSRAPD